jgi:hypothetical protein
MTMTRLFFIASVLALASCGDNDKVADAHVADAHPDAPCSNCPAAPALGVQLDRLGRPAINTALNHGFDSTSAAGIAKDAYNIDGSPGGWAAANTAAFATSLAMIDGLDTGLSCTNGTCTADPGAADGAGCGNQVEYNGVVTGGGSADATSYTTLATIMTDDELYLDTSKTICEIPGGSHANYLGVEVNVLASLSNTCGGRAPTNDVMDASYTALAIGLTGFDTTTFAAAISDGAGPHADTSNDTFPFFGAPH